MIQIQDHKRKNRNTKGRNQNTANSESNNSINIARFINGNTHSRRHGTKEKLLIICSGWVMEFYIISTLKDTWTVDSVDEISL